MVLLGKPGDWKTARKEMTDPKFIDKLKGYDIEKVPEKTIKQVKGYTKLDNFLP